MEGYCFRAGLCALLGLYEVSEGLFFTRCPHTLTPKSRLGVQDPMTDPPFYTHTHTSSSSSS